MSVGISVVVLSGVRTVPAFFGGIFKFVFVDWVNIF